MFVAIPHSSTKTRSAGASAGAAACHAVRAWTTSSRVCSAGARLIIFSPQGQAFARPPHVHDAHPKAGPLAEPLWHTGETVVLTRRRKRRREVAELLQALVDKHPHKRVYVAWDNSGTHEEDEVEAVVRGAAGQLVLLYLPTYSLWLNPIEMLWRQSGARSRTANCS